MDIPADVLKKLKCHQCDMYLSRSPVYLEHDGAAACSRCFSPKRPTTRNKEYEAVAKLLRFPCKNRDLGCGETVGFEEVAHEARCSYRQYVCPVLGSSRCEWLGTRSQLLQHCQDQHPDLVLHNPCSLTHDITTSSQHNYLLQAFQLLFLLLTKVCVTSGKIYHSVRLLDRDDMAKDFTYTLHIKRNKEEITKRGDVAPQGVLALQEPTALDLDINSVLSVLGGWGGASCTVEVERRQTDTDQSWGQCTMERESCYWRRQNPPWPNPEAEDWQREDTEGADWREQDTEGADWREQDTEGADWREQDTEGADWREQDTEGADWREQETGAQFKNTEGTWTGAAYWQEQDTEAEDRQRQETGATGWWDDKLETCVECGADVTLKSYRDDSGWRCEYCSPDRLRSIGTPLLLPAPVNGSPTSLTCKKHNKGCPYEDIPYKCKKHELYFCPQRTYCNLCREPVSRGTLSAHYDSEHGHVMHSTGSTWRATRSRWSRYALVTSPAGTALCAHRLSDSEFNLEVYLPVLSERLCELRCKVHVTQSNIGLTRTYTPDVTYNTWCDWHVNVNKLEFPTWSHELNVIVEITVA